MALPAGRQVAMTMDNYAAFAVFLCRLCYHKIMETVEIPNTNQKAE